MRMVQPELVGAQQQLGKVHQTAAPAVFLVGAIDRQHGAHKRVALIDNMLGPQALVFLTVDIPLGLAEGPLAVIQLQALIDPLDQAQLIVAVQNLEVLGQPGILPVGLEQPVRQAVEGAHPHGAGIDRLTSLVQKGFQAPAHFPGRLVGKGHGHDGVGRGLLDLDQPGNAVHQHTGFAAAGTGQNQLVGRRGGDRFALGIVQIVEQE